MDVMEVECGAIRLSAFLQPSDECKDLKSSAYCVCETGGGLLLKPFSWDCIRKNIFKKELSYRYNF